MSWMMTWDALSRKISLSMMLLLPRSLLPLPTLLSLVLLLVLPLVVL
jgi:hypothetical protein